MKTDDLIASMTADISQVHPGMKPWIFRALVLGGLVSLGAFMLMMGVRADIDEALGSWRFGLKIALVAVALGLTFMDCVRLASPAASGIASRWSLLIPLLLVGAVGLELITAPAAEWGDRLAGSNAWVCMIAIPALALAPLIAGLAAMRAGAPSSPMEAGAAVGRLAAALAAILYAWHCFDDSPLFVATWYTLATLPVMLMGAIAGHFMLRW